MYASIFESANHDGFAIQVYEDFDGKVKFWQRIFTKKATISSTCCVDRIDKWFPSYRHAITLLRKTFPKATKVRTHPVVAGKRAFISTFKI